MTEPLLTKADGGRFGDLFRLDLFWHSPDHAPIQVELEDGYHVSATNVSSYKGVRVWEVAALPGAVGEAKIDQAIAKVSTNRLVIFHGTGKQVWRWPSRTSKGNGVISRPARHVHLVGQADPQFVAKLNAIRLPSDVVIDVNEVLSRVRAAFDVETKSESKRASRLMAQMYSAVERSYAADFDTKKRDHEISVTLARVLFLLFGDDTEMWKAPDGEPLPGLFQDFVKDHTARDGSDIGERLNELFRVLDTAPVDRNGLAAELLALPYVNGGIFEEPIRLPSLGSDFREAVLAASAVDWSTISPAIFGSMFQSVRDAQTRRELGEHYTSEVNILKTLNPLFLDELRAEADAALTRETPQKRINALNALWKRLGEIRYLDPACGCGNFIIVAYRELRELELRVMDGLANLQQGEGATALGADWTHLLKVTLDHFSGIELDEWPARIAETAMFLMDRQCDLKMRERFGVAPERLPIQRSAKIVVGNALRMDWSEVVPAGPDVIMAGNPPFLGPKERSAGQTDDLRLVWGVQYDGFLDYVSGWYAKAIDYYGEARSRWAFVSTNSIAQGQAVPTLWGAILANGWRVRFAHRTFPWTSESSGGAAVHCVIVGFDRERGTAALLFDYIGGALVDPLGRRVDRINAYLVDGPNVLVRKRMRPSAPQLPEVQAGSKAVDWGFLTVEPDQYDEVADDSIAVRYLRRYRGGDELINGLQRWCLWFVGADLAELERSALIRGRLNEIRQRRAASPKLMTRRGVATPHLFEERRQPSTDYLGIPQTFAEGRTHATVARLSSDVIASIKLFTSPDPDGFLFAMISSSMFMTWQKTVGGRMKSDPSFTNTIVWNTLPVPTMESDLRAEIVLAGQEVLRVREENPTTPLGMQYDPLRMRLELTEAHQKLDALVCAAFGANGHLEAERDRQRLLFEQYEKTTVSLQAGGS
ncbi:class I SAM-dependent DNA methyltransferase [Trujillonella endophytica]|uniref:site-specific DNA-methyltransferase (adenine-specific) n=1 Tax=Trujillonella endophytica TaxID=673521 RepID=A0A1H8S8Q1_9ACTN|nr:DNA methyltransferase [Trujillella endophytica]SEO75429.1 hypothetical protein SAMN05660991_01540 [Trujillella endophytica]